MRAFRALPRFKGDAAVGTWLHRIAVNVCLNRKAVKVPRFAPIEQVEPVDVTSERADAAVLRGERAKQVRAAVARLPPKQRAALILRTYHDLPHDEIAKILGSSVGAVKANFFHALANLKRLMESS